MPLQAGAQLGPYEIVAPLGAGGMGEVYRARDPRLGREVAVKVLPVAASQDSERLQRFRHEARAVAALNHPNILAVHDVGSHEGTPYLVCELLEGETLRESIRHARLTTAKAAEYAAQVADGLAAAHEKGIAHRDIKPENLFLTRDGRVKILDFGLAKLRHGRLTARGVNTKTLTADTKPGTLLGTLGYMSPEQVRGEEADHRSDVFALGAVLYEMLTGRHPFNRESEAETLHAIVKEDPPEIREGDQTLPREVRRVLRHCLEKRAEDRFQSARDLSFDLRALAGDAPSVAPRALSARLAELVALASVAGIVLALGVRAVVNRREPPRGPEAIRSVAVLPLKNLSGDVGQEYFTEGMTDALIGSLSRIGALRVISRTSTLPYKDARVPLRQIARDLGVDAVVEGSVLWSGERVRISAQLSHAPSDRTIWARSYERDLRDVLALQRELAEAITEEIRIKLTAEERARIRGGPPVDHAAYQAYLKGRYHLNKRTDADARQAIEHFQEALATHPEYAEAYAGLASCYSYLSSVMGGRPPRDLRPLAIAAARKALAIDDSLTEAHDALAAIQLATWEWAAAEQSLRRAIELDASSASAHGLLSHYFTLFGRTDEALAEARIAQSLDPFSARAMWWEGMAFLNGRRYDEAIATFRRSLELDPKYVASQWFLGVAHAEKGSFAEAVAAHERALELSGRGAAYLGSLGGVYARFGRKREALSLLEELKAAAARGYVTPAAFVFLYTGLGDRNRAFEWLERAAEDQTELIKFLAVYPPLDPLRSDARFAVLLRRVGLPQLSRNAA